MNKNLRKGCLLLAIFMVLTIAGCGSQTTESWITVSEVVDGDTEESSQSNSGSTGSNQSNNETAASNQSNNNPQSTGSSGTAAAGKTPSGDFDYNSVKLKGVTLRRLIWYTPGAAEKKMVDDFEKKYGCKIKDIYCEYNDMSTKMVAGMNSGDVIDIATLYGAFFPSLVIGNLFEPIDKYVVKSELMNKNNPTGGGFDLDKMEHYIWGGHYYGFSSYTNVDMPVLFYNKSIFQQYNQKTPLEYIKEGNWNWDTFYKTGYDIKTQSDSRIAGLSEGSFLWFPMAGVQLISFSNGNPVSNLTDPKVLETMQFYKKCHYGNTALTMEGNDFFKGKAAMHLNTFSSIQMELASKSVQANYEIAAVPCSKNNTTGKYPTSWSKAIGIGKGSLHPEAVAVYARWASNYIDAPDALNQFTSEQKSRILTYFKNVMIPNATYGKTIDYAYGLMWETKTKDPAAILKSFSPLFTAAIKDTINK